MKQKQPGKEIVLYPNNKASIQDGLFEGFHEVYVYNNDGERKLILTTDKKRAEALFQQLQQGIEEAKRVNAKFTIYHEVFH
jgi:hypothetical protein